MNNSLLFLPDISGFTEFVQSTEAKHSQHVIAELLEILVEANTEDLKLAEIEGDALFFYKEEEIPSLEKLLAQVETMFTAFYSHLKLLEKNRICPCNACSSAPNLQLKIIAHSGELEFITVQGKRKPFGTQVIEVHRLMKNAVNSDNYVLFSSDLTTAIDLPNNYQSKLYNFKEGENVYDKKKIAYQYSVIDKEELKLKPYAQAKKITFDKEPNIKIEKLFPVSVKHLLDYLTTYSNRHSWAKGVQKIEYNVNEVVKVGSEHLCIVNNKQLNFVTVTKEGKPGQIVYGELTTNIPIVDKFYQFYIVNPIDQTSCKLELEIYWKAKSPIKRFILSFVVKNKLKKKTNSALNDLLQFIEDDIDF